MTLTIGSRVTTKMGANKGSPGTVIDIKKLPSDEISEVLIAWDSGGAGWQWVSNVEIIE
jgi:hypothetical protein